MWDDFSDYELAQVAGNYGMQEFLVFSYDLTLANRSEIERMLTEVEYDAAFGEESQEMALL